MANQLRDLVCVSRLAGRFSDTEDSDPEDEGGLRSGSRLDSPGSVTSCGNGQPSSNTKTSVAGRGSRGVPRRDLKTPMPSEDFLEQTLQVIDAEAVKQWLVQSKTNIGEVQKFWRSASLVYQLTKWWLADCSREQRRVIVEQQVQSVRGDLRSALHIGMEDGSVDESDLQSMMRAVLREYPRRIHTGKDGYGLLLRYVWLFALSELTPEQTALRKETLANIRCSTTSQKHIEWLLSARVFSLTSLCAGIVKEYCRCQDVQCNKMPAVLQDSPMHSQYLDVHLAFEAVRLENQEVLQFLFGERGREPSGRAENMESGKDDIPEIHHAVACVQAAAVDMEGRTLPVYAVTKAKVDILHYLVTVLPKEVFDKPAGKSGNTPFHIAAASGNTDAVKCLLSAGINCSKWNAESRGATPLHVAVLHGNVEVVKLLLKGGARVNAKMGVPATDTPLRIAAELCRANDEVPEESEVYQVLIRNGAML